MDSFSDRTLRLQNNVSAWTARHDGTAPRRLPGGALSTVVYTHTPQHGPVVVKAVPGSFSNLESEARWLSRHRSAPKVLDLDADLEVMVCEYVESTALKELDPPIDLDRESRWLAEAAAACEDPHGHEENIATKLAAAGSAVIGRSDIDKELELSMLRWQDWAVSQPTRGWQAVPMDVISKNTLVDSDGIWWAIDPMVVLAPQAFVWAPWAVDRTRHKGDRQRSSVELSIEFVATSPDPTTTALWMPGICQWSLWWCRPGRPSNFAAIAQARWWHARWEDMVL